MLFFSLVLRVSLASATAIGSTGRKDDSLLGTKEIYEATSITPRFFPKGSTRQIMRKATNSLQDSVDSFAADGKVEDVARSAGPPIPYSTKPAVWKFGSWGKSTCQESCAKDGQRCSEDVRDASDPYKMSSVVRSLGYRCNDMSGPLKGIESPSITLGNEMDQMGKCWYNIVKNSCNETTPPSRRRLCKCVEPSTCAGFQCPAGYVGRRNNAMTNCMEVEGCTFADRDRCCEEMAFCDEYACPPGYIHKLDAHRIECPEAVCGNKYTPEGYAAHQCCEPRKIRQREEEDEAKYRSGCRRPTLGLIGMLLVFLAGTFVSACLVGSSSE